MMTLLPRWRAELALLAANRRLLKLFEKKIQAKLAEVWGEEISAGTQKA